MGGFIATQSVPSAPTIQTPEPNGSLTSPASSTNPQSSRDWDSQSATNFSESTHSTSTNGVIAASMISMGLPPNQMDLMRDTVNKRIMTLTYLRSTHEGKMYWFNTVLLTREELSEQFNQPSTKKRAYRFAVLAMSLASLFDIQTPSEYLKALTALMTEYEAFQDETIKPKAKKRNIFRASKLPKRPGGSEYAGATYDASDNYLLTPNIPFQLDYHQTIISLADILSETYQKLLRNIVPFGPPVPNGEPSRQGAQTPGLYGQLAVSQGAGTPQMFGPLGVITPYPGLTSLWPGGTPPADEMGEGSLWSLASSGPTINVAAYHSTTSVIKELEGVKLIDGKLKKIIASLLKELDTFARGAIKAELESLDPLLKNLVLSDQMQGDGGEEY